VPDVSPTVAFDVTALAGVRTGIGLAVAESLAALERAPNRPRLIPYAFGAALLGARRTMPRGTRVVPVPTRALLWAWGRAEHPQFDGLLRPARLIHATSFVSPPSRLPSLVTVHDCAFARFPEMVSPSVRLFDPILRRALARGAWLHCSTETVAAESEELFGIDLRRAGRLVIVPFGVPRLGPASPLSPAVSERLRGAPYILALGRLESRKNLPRLVEAFGAIANRHTDLHLVIAGPDGPDRPSTEAVASSLEPGMRERVILTGPVGHGARRTLIEGAAVLSYPSLYEGFGFPMLEAMTLGVPVVAANGGALPEVAGGAAHLVDPSDPDSIATGLDLVLTDAARRRELIALGRVRASAFNWTKTARGLLAAYEDLAGDAARISS